MAKAPMYPVRINTFPSFSYCNLISSSPVIFTPARRVRQSRNGEMSDDEQDGQSTDVSSMYQYIPSLLSCNLIFSSPVIFTPLRQGKQARNDKANTCEDSEDDEESLYAYNQARGIQPRTSRHLAMSTSKTNTLQTNNDTDSAEESLGAGGNPSEDDSRPSGDSEEEYHYQGGKSTPGDSEPGQNIHNYDIRYAGDSQEAQDYEDASEHGQNIHNYDIRYAGDSQEAQDYEDASEPGQNIHNYDIRYAEDSQEVQNYEDEEELEYGEDADVYTLRRQKWVEARGNGGIAAESDKEEI